MNKLWGILIIICLSVGIILGNEDLIFSKLCNCSKVALKTFFTISQVIIFWSGMLNILESTGVVKLLIPLFRKPLKFIFKSIASNDLILEKIIISLTTSLMGLGGCGMVYGLKAFALLDELATNEKEDAMQTLVVINCTSLCLIPTSMYSYYLMYQGYPPSNFLLNTILITIISFTFGLIFDYGMRKVRKWISS